MVQTDTRPGGTPASSPDPAATSTRLLEGAARLLSEEGPAALSARRVAAEAGVSTMGLYTHFGSMAKLVEAVIDEGFRRLGDAQDAAGRQDNADADPVAELAGLTRAQVDFARAQPHLYAVMFGSVPLGNFRPTTPAELSRGRYTLERVAAAMERAIAAGRFRPDVPFHLANQWWITVHGYVLAEAAGYLQPPASEAKVLWPALQQLFVGMGDIKETAQTSMRLMADHTGITG